MKPTHRRSDGYQRSSLNMVPGTQSRRAISRNVGPVVYFIRTKDGLIKIGHTKSILQRHVKFGGWDCILAIHPGTRDDEQDALDRFAGCLARGREYFYPFPELVDYINEMRDELGVPPIVA